MGAGILVVILLAGVLVELPELRLVAAMAIFAGVVFGDILFLWRSHYLRNREAAATILQSQLQNCKPLILQHNQLVPQSIEAYITRS